MPKRRVIRAIAKKYGEEQAVVQERIGLAELERRKKLERLKPAEKEIAEVRPREFDPSLHIKLDTGEWVNKVEFDEFSPENQAKLKELGIERFNKYIKEERVKYDQAIEAVKDYKDEEGRYNIVEAIKKEVPKFLLERVFSEESIENAEQRIVAEDAVQRYKRDEGYDILTATIDARDAPPLKRHLQLLFGEDAVVKASVDAKDLEAKNVRLSNDDWVSKDYYDKLHEGVQKILYDKGIDKYNEYARTSFPGAIGLVMVQAPFTGMRWTLFGTTENPLIVLDEGGNRIWIGERWPEEAKRIPIDPLTPTDKISIPGRWPEEVSTFQPITPLTHIRVGLGVGAEAEWVTHGEFKAVGEYSKIGQEILEARGIVAYSKWMGEQAEIQRKELEPKIETGEILEKGGGYIPKEDWDLLTPDERTRVEKEGLLVVYTPLPDGNMILTKQLDAVAKDFGEAYRTILLEKGFDAFDALVAENYITTDKGELFPLEGDEEKDTVGFNDLDETEQERLMREGVRGLKDLWQAELTAAEMDIRVSLPDKQREVFEKEGFAGLTKYIEKQEAILSPFEIEVDESWREIYEPTGMPPPEKLYNIYAALIVSRRDDKVLGALTGLFTTDQLDKVRDKIAGKVSVEDLEQAMRGNWLERAYVSDAIGSAGFYKEELDEKPRLFRIEDWGNLTDKQKEYVAEIYITPAIMSSMLRKAKMEWAVDELPKTIDIKSADEIMHAKGKWRLKLSIKHAMGQAGFITQQEFLELPEYSKKLVEKWDRLSKEEKERALEEYKTFAERLDIRFIGPTFKALEELTAWVTDDPSEVKRIVKGFPVGLAKAVVAITIGMGGATAKGFEQLMFKAPKSAAVEMAEIPMGMVEYVAVQAPKEIADDPYSGISMFIGALALPFVAKGVLVSGRGVFRFSRTIAEGGVLPRALKAGTSEVYRIKVPEGFERLTSELDIIARDQAQVKSIFESGLSQKQQIVKIKERLTTESIDIYDSYMTLINEMSKFEVPKTMLRDVNFSDISRMPTKAGGAVKSWTQRYANDIKVHGSFPDWIQTKGVKGMWKPNDLDINIMPRSKLTPEIAAKELANVVRKASGENVRARGGSVEIQIKGKWTKLIDIHYEGEFGKLPYEWTPKKPIVIDGIPFERLGEQAYSRG